MLGYAHARTRHDEGCRGRDIECARGVAAGAARIDQEFIGALPIGKDRRRMASHGAGKAHQFLDGFALLAQNGQESNDRLFPGASRKNLLHSGVGFQARKMAIVF